jgi:hypothetical protein
MSGHIARKGFLFQDLYLLFRVLQTAGESLESGWRSASNNLVDQLNIVSQRFGIEASATASGDDGEASSRLDWDVLVRGDTKLEFAEVKSGSVTKTDRLAFWKRLRRELARVPDSDVLLLPILVVDPRKSDSLEKWEALPLAAADYSASVPSRDPSGNVLTTKHLLEEALWWICSPDRSLDNSDPAADQTTVLNALSRFELHCHEFEELESNVTRFIDVLFPGGLTETNQTLLLGWLGKRATGSERRLFTISELLQEIGILQDAISLEPGTLKKWRVLWDELPPVVRERTRLCLGENGASMPAASVQVRALDALGQDSARPTVILAPGGAGKSVFLAQAAEAAKQRGDDVFHCGADDVTIEELEEIAHAIRFFTALMGLRRPTARILLCIDGLDEADASLRKRWVQQLARIASIPNVRVLVSIRDVAWRADGTTKSGLASWSAISLDLWPESIVLALLAPTAFGEDLPPSVIDLLRTPILLDLFWRTFVEIESPNILRASSLQTRHSLLAAFWRERLIESPRHTGISDMLLGIGAVVSRAGTSVGGFLEESLDADVVQTLLSEGVLSRESRLQQRLRFRHPLLRDFAFAQWCLAVENPIAVSQRWNSIAGGLQRHGALRAMVEGLSNPDSSIEYPSLTLGSVVQTIAASDRIASSQMAHVLGAREPIPSVDPQGWASQVQSALPAEFGGDLLSAARLSENGAWAERLERWSDDAPWLNGDYPTRVWEYAEKLLERARSSPGDLALKEQSLQATRKLRSISELPRFSNEFSQSDRWLKMRAILCVVPALPDLATMDWVERELTQANWRTRLFLFEKLIYLCGLDPGRAATFYKRAAGLVTQNGRPEVDVTIWSGSMAHQAIDCSLGGKHRARSLLKEFPATFLPVALDLFEALWLLRKTDPWSRSYSDEEPQQLEPPEENEAELLSKHSHSQTGDLIDDSPIWRYLRIFPSNEACDLCHDVIQDCIEHLAKDSRNLFLSSIAILRSSRMASIHLLLFDVLLDQRGAVGVLGKLRECIVDNRIYRISGFEGWIEEGLAATWPILAQSDRTQIFDILRELHAEDGTEVDALQYLARLPIDDLPDDLRAKRPHDGDEEYRLRGRPKREDVNFDSEWTPVPSEEFVKIVIGQWPEDCDRERLESFAQATADLSSREVPVEKIKERLGVALQDLEVLLPSLSQHAKLLEDSERFWVWERLVTMLQCFRRNRAEEGGAPDPNLIFGLADLALGALSKIPEDLPGTLPDGDIWTGHRESGWQHALRLADEVFTWPPVADDEILQSSFVDIVRRAFATENPLVQLVTSTNIRPWHWFRDAERRAMHDDLVWFGQKNVSVLSWSLGRLSGYSDVDIERVTRVLLHRSDLRESDHFANRLGELVGRRGMTVFADGSRSSVAELARAVIERSGDFSFLQSPLNRAGFFRGLSFGLKERAKLIAVLHPQLASDYGSWSLGIWRIARMQSMQSEVRSWSGDVVLFSMYWLGKSDRQETNFDPLRMWWLQLNQLRDAVVREGGRADCFQLFFDLRQGDFNDISGAEEMLGLVENFMVRLIEFSATVDLGERPQADMERRSWRECSAYAAELIDSLRRDGILRTEMAREHAHRLLAALAAEPIRCSPAVAYIHRLQNE